LISTDSDTLRKDDCRLAGRTSSLNALITSFFFLIPDNIPNGWSQVSTTLEVVIATIFQEAKRAHRGHLTDMNVGVVCERSSLQICSELGTTQMKLSPRLRDSISQIRTHFEVSLTYLGELTLPSIGCEFRLETLRNLLEFTSTLNLMSFDQLLVVIRILSTTCALT
jgi:hypothetical protein